MKEQLISFETAKLAKEKGFDIECLNFYGRCFPDLNFNTLYSNIKIFGGDFYCCFAFKHFGI